MKPQMKFHLVFSLIMGLFMISLMTFVVTAVNVGFGPAFLPKWGIAFSVAYVVGVPVIFFLAPPRAADHRWSSRRQAMTAARPSGFARAGDVETETNDER